VPGAAQTVAFRVVGRVHGVGAAERAEQREIGRGLLGGGLGRAPARPGRLCGGPLGLDGSGSHRPGVPGLGDGGVGNRTLGSPRPGAHGLCGAGLGHHRLGGS
jgi:hypothetical protein